IRPPQGKHFQFYVDFVAGKLSIEEYFEKLRNAANSNASVSSLREAYSAGYLKHSKIDEKMINLAKKLKGKYTLVCITNTNLLHMTINKERGLFDVFDKVFSSTNSKRLKDFSWFKDILSELNVKGKECIFVDDLKENIEESSRAGINSILFTNYESLVKDLSKHGIIIQ
ncbi:MAG: HAD-IA family hydrolase, partial [archaeon]